ncbi:unnamed protein product [Durusdinium trenchii]|uniref:Uncharacterized protein n=1 Tax=Durusdinium trenchii TaxID=1381693 RepID=A0ABP0J072_9DINO
MGLEEIADRGNIAGVTPAVGTPGPGFGIHGCAARTPVLPVERVLPEADPVQDAVEVVQDHEDQLSVKEEMDIATDIDSSSGSDSESSSTSSDEYPKRLRCFPNDPGRVRSREDAVEALDKALERVRKARRSAAQ